MHGPDGTDYQNQSVFQEVAYPERIVFMHGGSSDGGPDVAFIATWTFDSVGEGTRVTIRMVFPTVEARDIVVREYGALEGAEQTLGRLAEHLPAMGFGARSVVIERLVDAPVELVFRCWTDATHLARWWAPHGFTNPVCEVDARVGGAWHIVMRGPDGTEYPCGGVYREIVPAERLVFTNIATDAAGKAVLDGLTTVGFAPADGKTKLTVSTRAIALFDFAMAYLAGMEVGWTQSLERLDAEVDRRI
jgi:uncharacterized protein YndB with AHSA1/START domain